MTICKYCYGEMTEVDGCVKIPFRYKDKKVLQPMKFGSNREGLYIKKEIKEEGIERCGDCACKIGNYHHSGCDIERCPRCDGQAISCDCKMEGEEE